VFGLFGRFRLGFGAAARALPVVPARARFFKPDQQA